MAVVNQVAPTLDSATTQLSGSASARQSADANFDTFLKLLAAQLQNQDPLDPLDGTQFTEQIASFSALEQQIATNDHLEQLLKNQDYSQQSLAVGFIGKEVLASGNVATLANGSMEITYAIPEDAVSTVIEIYDGDGVKVKTIDGEVNAGQYALLWDGTDDNGDPVADGNYKLKISSFDTEGVSVNPQTFVYKKVIGVRSDGEGGLFLGLSNGQEVSLSEAFTLRDPVVPTTTTTTTDETETDNG